MASEKPDFRNMTPEDIRKNISVLNREIVKLRKEANAATGKLFLGQAATLGIGVPATIAFPPLGAGIMIAGMLHGSQKTAESMYARDRLMEAEKLRHQFKTVWRARPGRPFRDVDARNKREAERRAEKQREKIMRDYRKKFGFFGPPN